jgi:hypothetical protein
VTYGNGLFVAVGRFGTILTSPDGVSWTARTSGTGNDLERRDLRERPLRGGGGRRRHPHLPGRGDLDAADLGDERLPLGVTYGNGLFVAVGDGSAPSSPPRTG